MAIMPRIRKLLARPASASTVGRRRESGHVHNNVIQEDALRAMLADDPNNERAFAALVGVVHRNSAQSDTDSVDPLAADAADEMAKHRLAMSKWALAEEFSGHPRAWYPLIELARLSLPKDVDDAVRRINAAVARENTGAALTAGIGALLEHGLACDAYNMGIAHWRSKEHIPAAGVAVVRAALGCDRQSEARNALSELLDSANIEEVNILDPQLVNDVEVLHR
ncbi:hypothetical protein [Timonella sp. A28]|uniref:hypothetical protein n=1 Tax=Timonella sp. A28 TaxID=3442640 RepID=UPI003EBBD656